MTGDHEYYLKLARERGGKIGPTLADAYREAIASVKLDGETMVVGRHELWLSGWRPAALNRLMYTSVRQRIRLKKADSAFITVMAQVAKIPKATRKRLVTLEITLTGRQKEADIDAYQKATLDALVSCGLLLGDRASQAEWGGVTYSRAGESGTLIILEDQS